MGETLGAEVAKGETPMMGGEGRKQHWGRQWEKPWGEMTTTAPPRMGNEMGETLVDWGGKGQRALGCGEGNGRSLWGPEW